jgi:Peptidase C65 Otubain
LQISETTPFVGSKGELTSLEDEYSEDKVYQQKVRDLKLKYKWIRRTRPDGNCFFRAFSYAYMEQLLNDPEEYKRSICVLFVLHNILYSFSNRFLLAISSFKRWPAVGK